MRVKVPLPDTVGFSSLESVLFPSNSYCSFPQKLLLVHLELLSLSTWCLCESILIHGVTVYMVFMR
jgi:hypothetical protein